jgi:hypothetical protein
VAFSSLIKHGTHCCQPAIIANNSLPLPRSLTHASLQIQLPSSASAL